jgi:hypothetical protein
MAETNKTITKEQALELSPEIVLIGFLVSVKGDDGNWREGIIPGTDQDAEKIVALCHKKIQEDKAPKWKM